MELYLIIIHEIYTIIINRDKQKKTRKKMKKQQ